MTHAEQSERLRDEALEFLGNMERANEVVRRARVLAILRRCAEYDNAHTAHQRADAALLACIDDPKIAEAFRAFSKWYS